MKKEGYYSSGQFAAKANVTVRTIRFYDKQNILKPSLVNENGARFYSDSDFVRLQQILLLKYLGFSLDEIRQLTIDDTDHELLVNSLKLQQKLVDDRIEQLQLVKKAIGNTTRQMEQSHNLDWSQMLELIHLTGMETSLATQYQNTANLSARIRLHSLFSRNKEGWFPWLFSQCALKEKETVLELGCGSGSLWIENMNRLPDDIRILLSDVSDGMIRDVRRSIGEAGGRFAFRCFDCRQIPCENESFDLVLANHVLFYCRDIPTVIREVYRVLKKGGRFICSTYGAHHMEQITRLVQEFDNRIVLSAEKLYEQFGLENGRELLSDVFSDIVCCLYDDELTVTHPQPLIEYILSCHGNQNQYLLDRYKEFRQFVGRRTRTGFTITKQAGIFICRKES